MREVARIESREHVALILVLVERAREQQPAVALDDPRVVARRERGCADAAREREQLGEAEAAVAADARVRRLAARVAADERRDDRAAKLLTQVERDVRQAARVTRLACRDHRARRAARALGVRSVRVEPQPQRDTDRIRPGLEQASPRCRRRRSSRRRCARVRRRAHRRRERVRERVHRQRLAADRAASSSVRPRRSASSPARRRRRSGRPRRAAGRRPSRSPRAESPYSSCITARVLAESREGSRGSPHHAPTSPVGRVHVNLDKPGGCRANRRHRCLGPTRAPFHMVLVLHGYAALRTRSSTRSDRSGDHPARAYDQWICCTPCSPRRRASASVRSN